MKYLHDYKELESVLVFVKENFHRDHCFNNIIESLNYHNIEQLKKIPILFDHIDKIEDYKKLDFTNQAEMFSKTYQLKHLLAVINYAKGNKYQSNIELDLLITQFPKYLDKCKLDDGALKTLLGSYNDVCDHFNNDYIKLYCHNLSTEDAKQIFLIDRLNPRIKVQLVNDSNITNILTSYHKAAAYSDYAKKIIDEFKDQISSLEIFKTSKKYAFESLQYINDDHQLNNYTDDIIINNILCLINIEKETAKINNSKEDFRNFQDYISLIQKKENAKFLNFIIKCGHINKYNSKKFEEINEEALHIRLKALHEYYKFKITYVNNDVIYDKYGQDLFKLQSVNGLTSIYLDRYFRQKITEEIIKLRLQEGKLIEDYLLNIFQTSISKKYINDLSKFFKFTVPNNLTEDKIAKIKNLATSVNKIVKENDCQHLLRQLIRENLSLEKIETKLSKLFTHSEVVVKQSKHEAVIGQGSKIDNDVSKKNKVKTKGISKTIDDDALKQSGEIASLSNIKASWVIDGTTYQDGKNSVLKAFNKEVLESGQKIIKSYFVLLSDKLILDQQQKLQFKNAATKGFVSADSKGKNGFKNLQKKIIELKINGDERLYTDKEYINEDGDILIILDNRGNHREVSKAVQNAKTLLIKIYVDCDNALFTDDVEANHEVAEKNNSNYNYHLTNDQYQPQDELEIIGNIAND